MKLIDALTAARRHRAEVQAELKARRDVRVRKIAEMLYDELSGKLPGVSPMMRQYEDNAALASVILRPRDKWDKHDEETYQLLREADYLGYEVHRKTPDRWGLANRLAEKAVDL